jgi:hypothetical protein
MREAGHMGVIDAYVRELDAALHGPRRARHDLVREAHDHLLDAAEHLGRTSDPETAERLAVSQFGAVEVVAPEFQAVVSATGLRRTSFALLLATIGQPLAWNLRQDDQTGPHGLVVLQQVVEYVGLATIAIAAITAMALGIGLRLGSVTPGRMRIAAWGSLASSLSIAVIGAAMMLASVPGWGDLAYGVAVTVLPMAVLAASSVRALRPLATSASLDRVQL